MKQVDEKECSVSSMERNKAPLVQARAVVLAVATLVLGGCATQTPFERPAVQVPAAWAQGQQASAVDATNANPAQAAPQPWWLALHDPVLTQLINDALARNNDLAQAAIKVRRAQLVAGQAASNQLPSVSVEATTKASRVLSSGNSTTRLSTAAVSASWELDLWGRLAALRNVADWEALATEEDRQAAAMSLVGTVAAQYWQVAYLNQRVEASQQSIGYARKTLTLVRGQYTAGATSGLEVAQAEQALAAQEASYTQWVQQRVEARNALAILFDGPPGASLNELTRLPEAALPEVPAGLPASLLSRRPDMRSAELRLRKSLATVDATRSGYYPTLSLTGSVGGSSESLSQVLHDPVGTVLGSLVLPFVQWREMQRSVAISQADYDVAALAYRQSWYQALVDVENALSARAQYEAQGLKLVDAVKAAQTAERLAEARYRAGSVPLLTWLDAQETRRQAENNLATNRLNRLNALATLYQTLGGGTTQAAGL
jgi:NodT family efflux transporter outer membrane factor (OMF) lipoprotein